MAAEQAGNTGAAAGPAASTGPGRSGLHLPWRPEELLRLVGELAGTMEVAPRAKVGRGKPERRWPMTLSVLVVIALQLVLNEEFVVPAKYLLPSLEAALLAAQIIANPVRFERYSAPVRAVSVALIIVMSVANAVSAGLLVNAIISSHTMTPQELLASGASVWVTNVIAFALWYWELDRGGPVMRAQGMSPYPDLLFPQMTTPELTRPGWDAQFVDYLYLSFTNASAFSPTDVMPLARWAKLTMLAQSAVSLVIAIFVIARAVNILK